MNIDQAKKRLEEFMGNQMLTFSITDYPSGEWAAYCNEISGIMTCGVGDNKDERDELIRDAILTAAGIDSKYANEILKVAPTYSVTHPSKNKSYAFS